MAKETLNDDNTKIVQFLRRRDYLLLRELGEGACGKTVLLRDEQIDEHFVCKKYTPYSETARQSLFANFVREVKLLHKVYHQNVVRVFNYYLYPDSFTGYILMEFIDGSEIDEYVKSFPERINDIFIQTLSGFSHLERENILHRDIRPANIMVRRDGVVKVIDLGFGKRISNSADFDKSVSLNLWCEKPQEFERSVYDFGTEVYFVGKLFEKIIIDNKISHFKFNDLLRRMCQLNPTIRTKTFSEIEQNIGGGRFSEIDITDADKQSYRSFSSALLRALKKIENGTKYVVDIGRIQTDLGNAYHKFMLEEEVPDPATVLRCFLSGNYYYSANARIYVAEVRDFLRLFSSPDQELSRIILANLHNKLDTVERYSDFVPTVPLKDDDIPF